MKILHVIRTLDPHSGGPAAVLRGLVAEQVRRGDDVTVLTTTAQAPGRSQPGAEFCRAMLSDETLRGTRIAMRRALVFGRHKAWRTFAYAPGAGRWIGRRLRDASQRPDVVHIHEVFYHLAIAAARQARRRGIPYIVSPYGSLDAGPLRVGSRRLKSVFSRVCLAPVARHAAFIQAATPDELGQLPDWVPKERVHVISHGVEIPVLDDGAAAEAFCEAFPQVRGRRIILCLSRIAPIKRMELLVEALAILRAEIPEAMLVLGGHDEGHRATVQAAVKRLGLEDSVLLTGFLAGAQKNAALACADMFALASWHENFSIATIEAMAYGLPALVTSAVAAHVHVDQSGGGLTVEGTPEDLARGMATILRSDVKALGRRGRDYAEKHLTWAAVVGDLEALCRQIPQMEAPSRSDNPSAGDPGGV